MNITGSPFHQGVTGMQNSSRSMLESANELVRSGVVNTPGSKPVDIVEPIINIERQELLFDASAKVVKASDEVLGALLDTTA